MASALRSGLVRSAAQTVPAPSFLRHLTELRRGAAPLGAMDPDGYHPAMQIPRKLRNCAQWCLSGHLPGTVPTT